MSNLLLDTLPSRIAPPPQLAGKRQVRMKKAQTFLLVSHLYQKSCDMYIILHTVWMQTPWIRWSKHFSKVPRLQSSTAEIWMKVCPTLQTCLWWQSQTLVLSPGQLQSPGKWATMLSAVPHQSCPLQASSHHTLSPSAPNSACPNTSHLLNFSSPFKTTRSCLVQISKCLLETLSFNYCCVTSQPKIQRLKTTLWVVWRSAN